MLNKNYNPKEFEEDLYKEEASFFNISKKDGPSFCIMMPPPNVTGSLHLGHALTYTLQDILIRYKRMQGFDSFWQPGTDHAGIATQMVVERELAKEGLNRQSIGREAFLKRAWRWKQYSGDTIVEQQKRLCIAANWEKSKFTLDDDLSNAVRKVFVSLYNEGLIYKDKRLVNWDSHFQTAISDLEVVSVQEKGHLWYIHYPLVDDVSTFITVATTRPETLLGDQAVAVHPEDDRYSHLIGKHVHLPLTDRTIPIIADEYCDMEKGSGAVKITPAHDFNDFDVGRRHNLPLLNILNLDGTLNTNVPLLYQGLTIEKARKKVLEDLESKGLFERSEEISHAVPYGDRSNVQIQPILTDQWFLNIKDMAEKALAAVQNDVTSFIPKQWENTYFDWLKNIQPWCISRQLWWGHQIPAWHGPDGHVFVAESEKEAKEQALNHYQKDVELIQDQDVLDTWFSSALWPFSTLGFPNQTDDLNKHYPTAILVTGFDIIFFWVARMMMMGLHFMKQVPFKKVYIHALVRDEKGQKMSKSKGNVIDPLELIDQFGADALRFTLSILSTPGRDIKLGASKVEHNRNFITKIYNSARFLQMNDCVEDKPFDPLSVKHPLSRFMIQELSTSIKQASQNLNDCRFDLYANDLYQWFWGTYCDQFLESLKPILASDIDDSLKQECKSIARYCFVTILTLLHPVIPMVTEHLWKTFCPNSDLLFNTKWPNCDVTFEEDHKIIQKVYGFSSYVRSLKGLLGIPPSERLTIYLKQNGALLDFKDVIISLARLKDLAACKDHFIRESHHVPFAVDGVEAYLELNNASDAVNIQTILNQKADVLSNELIRLKGKLSNNAYKLAKPDLYEDDTVLFDSKSKDHDLIQKILMVITG